MSLKQHTVKSYDQDLKLVASTLDEMMDLTLESIDMVAAIIKSNDQAIMDQVKKHDYKINSLDVLIEKKVTAILALRQPMAVDLRYIISSIKVASNLERIGDQAKSIMKKINVIGNGEFEVDVIDSLNEMIEISKSMIKNSVAAFNDFDQELAQQVLNQDDKIDVIYKNMFNLTDKKTFSKEQVQKIINTLFIAKSFERLADNSTNIAEIAQFVVSGESK